MSEQAPPHGDVKDRIATAVQRLVQGSKTLDSASAEFSKPINKINEVLQQLHLGVTGWANFETTEDPNGNWWTKDIGYARIDGKWGLAIREREGNYNEPYNELREWHFNEAPRSMRIAALEKLPDLLDKLTKSAEKTAKKLQETVAEANELADVIVTTHKDLKSNNVLLSSADEQVSFYAKRLATLTETKPEDPGTRDARIAERLYGTKAKLPVVPRSKK